jgi:hypothetical protein
MSSILYAFSKIRFTLLFSCSSFFLFVTPSVAFVGTIQNIKGDVRIWERSGLDRPAQIRAQIYQGDILVSSAGSYAEIKMVDGALILLTPLSKLALESYAREKNIFFRLTHGGLRMMTGAIARLSPEKFKLVTPNATIGIRGTDFSVFYLLAGGSARPGTYNRVFSGATVLSSDKSAPILVSAGDTAFLGLETGAKPEKLELSPEFTSIQKAIPSDLEKKINKNQNVLENHLFLEIRFSNATLKSESVTSRGAAQNHSKIFQVRLKIGETSSIFLATSDFPKNTVQVLEEEKLTLRVTKLQNSVASIEVQAFISEKEKSKKIKNTFFRTQVDAPLGSWVLLSTSEIQGAKDGMKSSSSRESGAYEISVRLTNVY